MNRPYGHGMSRFVRIVAVFALLAAACGGGPATISSTSPTAPAPDTTTDAEPDGPVAPSFTLVLGDGSTFDLAREARPVYMVFWAEW
jgi:hypothetical protein